MDHKSCACFILTNDLRHTASDRWHSTESDRQIYTSYFQLGGIPGCIYPDHALSCFLLCRQPRGSTLSGDRDVDKLSCRVQAVSYLLLGLAITSTSAAAAAGGGCGVSEGKVELVDRRCSMWTFLVLSHRVCKSVSKTSCVQKCKVVWRWLKCRMIVAGNMSHFYRWTGSESLNFLWFICRKLSTQVSFRFGNQSIKGDKGGEVCHCVKVTSFLLNSGCGDDDIQLRHSSLSSHFLSSSSSLSRRPSFSHPMLLTQEWLL